ncbi:MAG TPA: hypothetical protein VK668_20955 [Mucilaginibacter sp.]|nr:hypothetical protein [Mucilaginibacter sp.]
MKLKTYDFKLGRCLRPVLFAYTARALATWPVSATITNAAFAVSELGFIGLRIAMITYLFCRKLAACGLTWFQFSTEGS